MHGASWAQGRGIWPSPRVGMLRPMLGKVNKDLLTNLGRGEREGRASTTRRGWFRRGKGSYCILLCVGLCKLGYGFASTFYHIDVGLINTLTSEMLGSNHWNPQRIRVLCERVDSLQGRDFCRWGWWDSNICACNYMTKASWRHENVVKL